LTVGQEIRPEDIRPIPSAGTGMHAAARRKAPTREAKTARRLLWMLPSGFLLMVIITRIVVTSQWFSDQVSAYFITELAGKSRAIVQMSGVTFSWDFAPCFHDFEIYRISGAYKLKATTKEACIQRWASAVGSGFHAIQIKLAEPSISVEGLPDAKKDPVPVKTTTKTITTEDIRRAALREINVVFDDLRLDWNAMPLPKNFEDGTYGPIDGSLTLQTRAGKTAATFFVREPSTGSALNGRINPTDKGWDISAGIEGDMVKLLGSLLTSAELDIRKLPTRGRFGAVYATKDKSATIDLDLEQYDVDLANDKVSAQRLVGFTAREQARIEVDFDRGQVSMKDAVVEINGVPMLVSIALEPGEGSPKFDLRADLRTTPLLKLLRSVPGAREPVFTKNVAPNVQFALSFSIAGRLRDPTTWTPKLEHRVSGIGPKGEGSGLELLSSTFRYYPLTKTGRALEPRLIGPASPSWQPYSRIPYILRRCVIVSEDSSFFFHNGIELVEVQDALREGLTTGEKARGGSTITQQLVKNLFLTRDRTALRKAQEMLLTFHLESTLSKEQIFELYMNIIEWGPNIYGIKEAALHYFGKRPENLSIREMAWLATIIPSPIPSHQQFEQGYASGKQNAKIDLLLERLTKVGNLTDVQLLEAKEAKIYFARPKKIAEQTPKPAEDLSPEEPQK
jgi:hypothetical protein